MPDSEKTRRDRRRRKWKQFRPKKRPRRRFFKFGSEEHNRRLRQRVARRLRGANALPEAVARALMGKEGVAVVVPLPKAKTVRQRMAQAKERLKDEHLPLCRFCGGTGKDATDRVLLQIANITQTEFARGTGLSPSLVSRMLSEDPKQARSNPTLATLRKMQEFFFERLKVHVPLDMIGSMLEG